MSKPSLDQVIYWNRKEMGRRTTIWDGWRGASAQQTDGPGAQPSAELRQQTAGRPTWSAPAKRFCEAAA